MRRTVANVRISGEPNNKIKLEQLAVKMWAHKLEMALEELEEQNAEGGEQLPGQQEMEL